MSGWEYDVSIVTADAEGEAEFIKGKWPGWTPPPFAPQAMVRYLDERGRLGWELVSLNPYRFNDATKSVIVHEGWTGLPAGMQGSTKNHWDTTFDYLAVWKRPLA
jgi:hypothetical protein